MEKKRRRNILRIFRKLFGNQGLPDKDAEYRLLATKGIWYDLIESGEKTFDWRKGIREINVGDVVTFLEASSTRILTGRSCLVKVNIVTHSSDFPEHFNWNGGEFTIIQFALV